MPKTKNKQKNFKKTPKKKETENIFISTCLKITYKINKTV